MYVQEEVSSIAKIACRISVINMTAIANRMRQCLLFSVCDADDTRNCNCSDLRAGHGHGHEHT